MAQRHPGSRRAARPESPSESDDVFIARALHLGKWAEAHQQAITVAGVLVAIGLFGLISYGNSRRSMNEAAAQQLELVHQSIGINDTEGARGDLITFLERFAGSAYEGEARLLLGQLYLEGGDSQQGIAVLAPIGASPREPIELQAATLLANAYEQERRWSEADALYLTIAGRSNLDFQVRNALAAAARIRRGQGDTAGAIELYRRVLADLDENSPDRGQFEMRIAEIEAAAT